MTDIYLGAKRVSVQGTPHRSIPLVDIHFYSHPNALGAGHVLMHDILTPDQARQLANLLLAEAQVAMETGELDDE